MGEIDGYARVIGPGLRAVWPLVASAVDNIEGSLVGGTALTTHLRHRESYDLDYMAHESFSGLELFSELQRASRHATMSQAGQGRMHAVIDGVAVAVFTAPFRGDNPGHVEQLQQPNLVDNMRVASLPDLLAMKLDVIMYRPKLRDYIDLAAIDNSGLLRLEDGIRLHMQRYGTGSQSNVLDRFVDLLENPQSLTADRVFAAQAPRVLAHLAGRVPELRAHIKRMRKDLHTQPSPAPGRYNAAPPAPTGGAPSQPSAPPRPAPLDPVPDQGALP